MKKHLFTEYSFKACIAAACTVILAVFNMQSVSAQCDNTVTLSCHDGVNVSISPVSCDALITAAMIASNYDIALDYRVVVTKSDGTAIAGGAAQPSTDNPGSEDYLIPCACVGDTLHAMVEYVDANGVPCGITCWGNLMVEDKTAPSFTDCDPSTGTLPDITISCEDYLAGANVVWPAIEGSCESSGCGTLDSLLTIDTSGLVCTTSGAIVLTHSYTVQDSSGNSATCVQSVYVSRKDVDDIVFPADYTGDGLMCSSFGDDQLLPAVTGEPSCINCPNIQYYYTDTHVDIAMPGCASRKLVRSWFVVDWCTGESETDNQIIEVIDDSFPIVGCSVDCTEILADPGSCTASFTFPIPDLDDANGDGFFYLDCSDVILTIEYAVLPSDQLDGCLDPCCTNLVFTPEYTPVVPVNGVYSVDDLPIGIAWFRYGVIDACGNELSNIGCTQDVIIKDNTPPTAICEGFTKIPLDSDGEVVVMAFSFDDGSRDECNGSIVSYEVRRVNDFCPGNSNDLSFGPDITVCCADLGTNITYELRVTDNEGNTSTCSGLACVSYDAPPASVTCPGPVTISCNDDYTDTSLTGNITSTAPGIDPACITGGISNISSSYNDSGLNDCGYGTVIRTITYIDENGQTQSCSQTITVQTDGVLLESMISWPSANIEVDGCGNSTTAVPTAPTVNTTVQCISLAISHSDGPYSIPAPGADYCTSFVRTWVVTDWCTGTSYDFDQNVTIVNGNAPTFVSNCDDITVNAADGECEAHVDLEVMVTDDCTVTSSINVTWTIDVNNDGDPSNDLSGTGTDPSNTYPAGTHKITFTAVDDCGNEAAMCMFLFTVVGDEDPTPICFADVIWSLDSDGTTEVWASDFDIKSTNGCGNDDALIFSFTADGLNTAYSYDCSDIPNGVGVSIPLEVFVIDQATGVYESCVVVLELQDNKDVCPDAASAQSRITGMVMDEFNAGLEDFDVMLDDMTNVSMNMESTVNDGTYAFNSVGFYNQYHVNPHNDLDPLNGVSTLDLVLIQRHILGSVILPTPYKLIAADVNDSGDITSIDLIELRKLILGIYGDYPANDSWVFVPEDHQFVDPTVPFNYPRGIYTGNLYNTVNDLDFIAVKVGDVNNTVTYNVNGTEVDNRSDNLELIIRENTADSNEGELIFDVIANDATTLAGMQFTFEFNADAISYNGYKGSAFSLTDLNFGTYAKDFGQVTFSFDKVSGVAIQKDDVLMSLRFTKQSTADVNIDINSAITKAEAYTVDNQIREIETIIDTRLNGEVEGDFVLYQNKPNPFGEETSISFYNGVAANVVLEVFDANGKTIYTTNKDFAKGTNSFKVNTRDLNSTGVLIYRIQSGTNSSTRKMIVVK